MASNRKQGVVMGLMNAARTRVGAAVITGTLLALGGGVAATAAVMAPADPAPVTDVVPTAEPAATTTTAAPVEPAPAAVIESPVAPAVAPRVADATAPPPEPEATSQPTADGELPEGWLPPSVPGGPPTAPPQPLPPAPCMPGEGGERCAQTAG